MTPTAREVLTEVAQRRGIAPEKIVAKGRSKPVFYARMEVAQRLSARGYSLCRIGRLLNHDHSCIFYYLGRAKKKPKPEPPPKLKIAAKRRWRRPRIGHIKCKGCSRCVRPGSGVFLVPYAGADFENYQWKERPNARLEVDH